RGLHRSFGRVHDYAGQTVDRREAHCEVVTPPGTGPRAGDVDQESCRTIGSLDGVQRGPDLTAAVRDDADVAGKQLLHGIDIARAHRRKKGGHELRVLRIDFLRTRRRAAWPGGADVRARAG